MDLLFLAHVIRKYSDNALTFKFTNHSETKKITRICSGEERSFQVAPCVLLNQARNGDLINTLQLLSKGAWSEISCFLGIFSQLLLWAIISQEQSKQPRRCCVHSDVCAHTHAECRAHTPHFHTAWWLKIKINEHWGCSEQKNQIWSVNQKQRWLSGS